MEEIVHKMRGNLSNSQNKWPSNGLRLSLKLHMIAGYFLCSKILGIVTNHQYCPTRQPVYPIAKTHHFQSLLPTKLFRPKLCCSNTKELWCRKSTRRRHQTKPRFKFYLSKCIQPLQVHNRDRLIADAIVMITVRFKKLRSSNRGTAWQIGQKLRAKW